jgi:hypothetical protein
MVRFRDLIASLMTPAQIAEAPGIKGAVHLISDVVHLIAVGAWIGALPPLAMLLSWALQPANRALKDVAAFAADRFSTLAMLSVGTLALSGIVNTSNLAGTIPALVETEYGRLLLLKILLFIAILGPAAVNRLRLLPQLPATDAVRQLRRNAEPFGSISVRTELDAVVLMFRSRTSPDSEWKSVEQRVPITWTPCRLGGRRAWFRCLAYSDGRYCGRRVGLLYAAGELFACRRCYGLAYASQRESLRHRGLGKARKIRARLGGSANMFDAFPDRPKGMHWRTYVRLRQSHAVAAARSTTSLMQFVDRLSRRSSRCRAQ